MKLTDPGRRNLSPRPVYDLWRLVPGCGRLPTCGEPRVMDAIVKNGRADFWGDSSKVALLPKETLNYVPKILAAIGGVAPARPIILASKEEELT